MQAIKLDSSLIIKTIFLILALLALAAGGSAQEKTEKQDKPEKKPEKNEDQFATIRVETDLVSIDVTVSDRDGKRGHAGLRAEDFVVYENGVRQKITNFSAGDVSFNLVLLLDTSGSTRGEVTLMRRAALRFLNEMRPQDRIAVIQFNRDVELLQDLTADRSKVEKALDRLQDGSATSFYDALKLTIDEVFSKVSGRKAIVALTDGVDSYGYTTYDQLSPEIERTGASIYFLELDTEPFTIEGFSRECSSRDYLAFSGKQLKKYVREHLEGGSESNYDNHCSLSKLERLQINRRLYESARKELREMATQTGGRVYPVKGLQELEPAYAQIADELRMQYSLGYYPSNEKHDGKWRTLRVEVKRQGLSARTRPGYRAPVD